MQNKPANPVKGLDVSHRQGFIDWNKVKQSGMQFAYIKATEGRTFVDPLFVKNMQGAKAAGILVGAYHFARPQNAPLADAQNFLNQLNKVEYDLLPVLDLEVTDKKPADYVIDWAKQFIAYVEKQTGHRVMLYTGNWFIEKCGMLKGLESQPLWNSYYRDSAPPDVGGFHKWTVWQYTNVGTVPGITGGVDLNIAEDLEEFKIDGQVTPSQVYTEVTQLPLKKGTKGDLVKKLQERLNTQPVDGLFGDKTEADVKQWQSLHDEDGQPITQSHKPHLVVDGIVGEKTWKALFPPPPAMYSLVLDGKSILDTVQRDVFLMKVKELLEKGVDSFQVVKRK